MITTGDLMKFGNVFWRGPQNSKTPPQTLIIEDYKGDVHTTYQVFRGYVMFSSGHVALGIPDDNSEYVVACIPDDVEVIKGTYHIRHWNTGGYGNTGDSAIIMCTPGTIIRVYGYKRRTSYLYEITENGVEQLSDNIEIFNPEDFKRPEMEAK